MKKKIAMLFFLVTIAITSAMANTEIDLNYYVTPLIHREQLYNGAERNNKITVPAFGFEGNFNWFYSKKAGIFDAGLNLDTGVHAIAGRAKMVDSMGTKSESTDIYKGLGLFLSLGPVLRFTFTDMFSIAFTPGLQLGFDMAGYEEDVNGIKTGNGFLDLNLAASINVGAKLWLYNENGLRMGLNIGADVDFPFKGIYSEIYPFNNEVDLYPTNREGNAKYSFGMNFRIFIGAALQLGDRAYDRINK